MCTPSRYGSRETELQLFNYASTESLFNAVKKQYANSHLLKLTLPSPPPPGVPSPALPPQLPNNPETSGPDAPQPRAQTELFTIKMIETDLASTAKFVRELAVESLIPWMGKCVLEWNEAVSVPFVPLSPQGLTRRVHSMWIASIRHLGDFPPDCSLLPDGCLVRGRSRAPPPKAQFPCLYTGIRARRVLWLLYLGMRPRLLSNGGSRSLRPSSATTNLQFPSGRLSGRKERVAP